MTNITFRLQQVLDELAPLARGIRTEKLLGLLKRWDPSNNIQIGSTHESIVGGRGVGFDSVLAIILSDELINPLTDRTIISKRSAREEGKRGSR